MSPSAPAVVGVQEIPSFQIFSGTQQKSLTPLLSFPSTSQSSQGPTLCDQTPEPKHGLDGPLLYFSREKPQFEWNPGMWSETCTCSSWALLRGAQGHILGGCVKAQRKSHLRTCVCKGFCLCNIRRCNGPQMNHSCQGVLNRMGGGFPFGNLMKVMVLP